jgi:hypothetical protein
MAAGDTDYGWIEPGTQQRIWRDFEDNWIQAFEALRDEVIKGRGFWKPSDPRANEIVDMVSWASCIGWEDVEGGYEYYSAQHRNGYGLLRRVALSSR